VFLVRSSFSDGNGADLCTADDLLVSKAHQEQLEPLELRIQLTRAFLHRLEPRLEYDLVELRDVAGPTGTEADVQALVVSRESASGAEASKSPLYTLRSVVDPSAVAKIRADRNLPPLDVFVIDVISSSADSPIPITEEGEELGDASHSSLVGETDQQRLKEGKMSSSFIRKWLAEGGESGRQGQ
jgi:pantetheine-phosphate adenylyltransferase